MANSLEQVRLRPRLWDIARIISGQQNLQGGYVATFVLQPTALLPANWALGTPFGINAFIWDIFFSTDTAISWTLGVFTVSGSQPLAPQSIRTISPNNPLVASGFGADVVAAPAVTYQIMNGFAPAGWYGSILGKGWLVQQGSEYMALTTGLVAANCAVTFFFTEYSNTN
jgi:hypothetical protein